MNLSRFMVDGTSAFKLSRYKTDGTWECDSKEEALRRLRKNVEKMADLQDRFYALGRQGLLIIFQAMDTAGKDGAIKHVMSGLNPQGTRVYSFKSPSATELAHDYLWRHVPCLPERGQISIFNRSYYEQVLVVRVHRQLLDDQRIPAGHTAKGIWEMRYRQIREFEEYLHDNGFAVVKIFLNLSKGEQKQRLLARIDNPDRNWKFSENDLKEREFWPEYQKCYQEAIRNTATKHAPWYVVPADTKWYARLAISEILASTLRNLDPHYPKADPETLRSLGTWKRRLMKS